MTTRFIRFTQRAQADAKLRFTSLMGLLFDPDGLQESFQRQAGNKAPGIDGVRKRDYAEDVDRHIADLSGKLRRMGYRPKPARRVYIPKADGGQRPLGIPSFEDRIVQDRVSLILQAIWEPEFLDCSYGFRPQRSAHQALRRVAEIITCHSTQWVVEADIKGFFNNVSHEHLLRFVAHRVSDGRLRRIIQRFLKAGVMEAGVVSDSEIGTPQGGLVSPVLANIYLHYVLDLWFEKRYAKSCRGKAYLVRYADDFVACFEDQTDAQRFLGALEQRLGQFSLTVEPTKTALIRFGSHALWSCKRDGLRRPRTFNFLGFTHYAGRSRRGRFVVQRKTQRQRIQKKLKALGAKLAQLRLQGGKSMLDYFRRHIQGHLQYYGVSGNSRSVRCYAFHAGRLLFKWLNRRSQRRSINWERFSVVLRGLLPPLRIVHHLYPAPL